MIKKNNHGFTKNILPFLCVIFVVFLISFGIEMYGYYRMRLSIARSMVCQNNALYDAHKALVEANYTDFTNIVIKSHIIRRPNSIDWKTLLHYACAYPGNEKSILFLMENRADLNAKDCAGRTPLHYAILCSDDFTYYAILTNHNADVEALDFYGKKPLDYYNRRK